MALINFESGDPDIARSAREYRLSDNHFAFALAGNFHHDVRTATGEEELRDVYRNYRNQILKVNELAACLAATLDSLIDHKLIAGSSGEEVEHWQSFKNLARKAQNSKNRASQQLQHQTAIIAAWGLEVFNYYGWHALPHEMTRNIRNLARVAAGWDDAVREINRAMLFRHERRIIQGDNQAQLIGEHSHGSKIQANSSPVEKKDVLIALTRFKTMDTLSRESDSSDQIRGAPIKHFGLKKDQYGMIVPWAAGSRVQRQLGRGRLHGRRKKTSRRHHENETPKTPARGGSYESPSLETPTIAGSESVGVADSQPAPTTELAAGENESCEEDAMDTSINGKRQLVRTQGKSKSNVDESQSIVNGADRVPHVSVHRVGTFERNVTPVSPRLVETMDTTPGHETLGCKNALPSARLGFERDGRAPSTLSSSGSEDVDAITKEPCLTNEIIQSRDKDMDSVLISLKYRHSKNIERLQEELNPALNEDNILHNEVRRKWLSGERWAGIFAEPETALGLSSSSAEHADVWYLTWESFRRYSDSGYVFRKPLVLKQQFQDGGMYSIRAYAQMLYQQYPYRCIDVNNDYSRTHSMLLYDYAMLFERADLSPSVTTGPVSKLVNLKTITNADEPLLTRLPRFQLLSTLILRADWATEKLARRMSPDVDPGPKFDLLGFPGSSSRPHLNALVGTWVRCLVGSQMWMVTSSLNDEDLGRFNNEGSAWDPRGKQRMIVLEQGDVLLIPPGLRVVYSVFSLESCLMSGGMFWDERNIPEILENLIWIAKHQSSTDGALAYQLLEIVETYEAWFEENYQRLASRDEDEYRRSVNDQFLALRSLGRDCFPAC